MHTQTSDAASQSTSQFAAAKDIPPGYSVSSDFKGEYRWESILAPECHHKSGFKTFEDAVADCRAAQGDDSYFGELGDE